MEAPSKATDAPPPLNYSLLTRKKGIAIGAGIIIADSCLLPIILFYALWFTKLGPVTGETPYFKRCFDTTLIVFMDFSSVFNIIICRWLLFTFQLRTADILAL